MNQSTAPQHTHDCTHCVFLGRFGSEDLYYHADPTLPTVIARFGSDGPQYLSGIYGSYGSNPSLTEARHRAEQRGLHTYNVYQAMSYSQTSAERQIACEALKESPLYKAAQQIKAGETESAKATVLAEYRKLTQVYMPEIAQQIFSERVWLMVRFADNKVFAVQEAQGVLDIIHELEDRQ